MAAFGGPRTRPRLPLPTQPGYEGNTGIVGPEELGGIGTGPRIPNFKPTYSRDYQQLPDGTILQTHGAAPKYTAPGAVAGTPTFQPASGTADPRITALQAELNQQASLTSGAPASQPGGGGGATAQQAQFRALLAQLMRGEGINVGPVSTDPEAAAFRVARRREQERARESEAARLGASGVEGRGEFDAALAGLEEATGESIAGFEGALTGRRRREATDRAVTGAQLQLADLDREQRAEEARLEREGRTAAISREQKMNLLNVLMSEQARQDVESRARAAEARTAAQFRESPIGKKEEAKKRPTGYGGISFRSAVR